MVRDATQSSNKHDENAYLASNGIQVKVRKGVGRGIMHHKYAIFHGKEICTGSYNWSTNAEKYNYENFLCNDEKPVVEPFQKEFEKLWKS